MKMIIVALALVAVAAAAAVPEEPIPIVRSEYNQQPDGSYTYDFETGNGIVRSEKGELKQATDEEGKPVNVLFVRGSYSYLNEDKVLETINYYADDTGYHAEGDSIPKAPQ